MFIQYDFFIEVYMRTSVEVNGTHPPALVGLVPFLCLPGDPTSYVVQKLFHILQR